MGKHFPFLSLSLSSLCVIYHRRRRSVHSCSKNYKTYEKSKISLWHNKNLKTVSFLFLLILLLSVVGRRWCNGETFSFFLSVFLLSV
jgi:hypothetical protein